MSDPASIRETVERVVSAYDLPGWVPVLVREIIEALEARESGMTPGV